MSSQFNITYTMPQAQAAAANDGTGQALVTNDLLRQLVDVQREQLNQLRANAAAHDASGRWRALLGRWKEEHEGFAEGCKDALPILERSYGSIIAQLIEELREKQDDLDNEFTLQDFLDRYGMRMGQIGNILNVVGPLVDAVNATTPKETTNQPTNPS